MLVSGRVGMERAYQNAVGVDNESSLEPSSDLTVDAIVEKSSADMQLVFMHGAHSMSMPSAPRLCSPANYNHYENREYPRTMSIMTVQLFQSLSVSCSMWRDQ